MTLYRRGCCTILLVLCCLSLIASPGIAENGGYLVEPASPGLDPGTPVEMVKVPVWEYTLLDLLIILALSVSPCLFMFPLELLLIAKLFAYLGFRRIRRNNVLENASREIIYQYIRNSPGTDLAEISTETGVSPNTIRYHLAVLRLNHKVTTLETSRNIRYYENSGQYLAVEQRVLKHLHSRPARTLLALIRANPDLSRIQLEAALGISGAGVNWYTNRLSEDGILTIRKDGRTARYEILPEAEPYLEKYLPESAVDPDTEETRRDASNSGSAD